MSILSFIVFVIMFALAAVHIYWGHGGNWPGNNRQDLVDKVYGEGTQFPSVYACYFVSIVLVIAGVLPLFTEGILDHAFKDLSWLNYLIAFPLLIRGVGGYLPLLEKRWTSIFIRYNRTIYNPLCIALAFGYILFGLK